MGEGEGEGKEEKSRDAKGTPPGIDPSKPGPGHGYIMGCHFGPSDKLARSWDGVHPSGTKTSKCSYNLAL